jgi:hypothetical protein
LNRATTMAGEATQGTKKLELEVLSLRSQVIGIQAGNTAAPTPSILSCPAPVTTSSVPLRAPVPLPAYPLVSILNAPSGSISAVQNPLSSGTTATAKHSAPSKFSGNTDKLHFEQWLNSLTMYLFTAGIRDDIEKVIVSMGFIEGRAQDQMRDYWDNFQTQQVVPTWADFLACMSNIFQTVQPKIRACKKLDEITEKHAKNFGKFAEEFTVPAIDSKFSDINLIHCINLALNSVTKATITSVWLSNPQQIPTQWNEYLQWALNAYKHTQTKRESTSVNALSTSSDKKKKPKDKKDLTKEQIAWIEKGLCTNGGQHPYKFKEKCMCKNPPYQGPYNLP